MPGIAKAHLTWNFVKETLGIERAKAQMRAQDAGEQVVWQVRRPG